MERESELLLEEILTLERERRDLLHSLTPTFSHWKKQQIHDRGEATTRGWRGRKEPCAPKDHDNTQLADLLNVMLEDTEDLGHRMLSMAYVVDKPGPPLRLYKAEELVSRASRLRRISEELYNDTQINNIMQQEQQGEGDDFLFLCRNYLQSSDLYKNELELNLTEEEKKEEKKEEEKEKERARKKEKKQEEKKQNEEKEKHMDEEEYASTMEFLKSMMDFRKRCFSTHRDSWERVWGSDTGRCGGFEDTSK